MQECLYEHRASGLKLRVQFTRDQSDVVNYESIRAVDSDYRACGPDLLDFFQSQLTQIAPANAQGTIQVVPLLSIIAEELE